MARIYVVKLDGNAFRRFGDLGLIEADLKEVLRYCDQIEALDRSKRDLIRPLWIAAIVVYWRCFKCARQTQLRANEVLGVELHAKVSHLEG